MGGAVSSGRDNTELIDNLMGGNYIRSRDVEKVFRALDRGDYMTPDGRDQAYKDLAWRNGPLHMSAPCIYSEVMEGLELKPGLSFLNVGSGTGYLSTLVGLILGSSGINHGVEIHPYVVEYATKKLSQFLESSPTVDELDFCEPKYVRGNGLCLAPLQTPYDRVYCGAGCPEEYQNYFQQLIKIGGILIMPLNDNLIQIKRTGPEEWVTRTLLSVSFASLRMPTEEETADPIRLDEQTPVRLQVLARAVIRERMRAAMRRRHPQVREPPPRAPPAKRACPRRICIPVDDDESDEALNNLHDLDRAGGAHEMNALLSLVLSMGHNRVAGALRVAPLDDSSSSAPEDAERISPTVDMRTEHSEDSDGNDRIGRNVLTFEFRDSNGRLRHANPPLPLRRPRLRRRPRRDHDNDHDNDNDSYPEQGDDRNALLIGIDDRMDRDNGNAFVIGIEDDTDTDVDDDTLERNGEVLNAVRNDVRDRDDTESNRRDTDVDEQNNATGDHGDGARAKETGSAKVAMDNKEATSKDTDNSEEFPSAAKEDVGAESKVKERSPKDKPVKKERKGILKKTYKEKEVKNPLKDRSLSLSEIPLDDNADNASGEQSTSGCKQSTSREDSDTTEENESLDHSDNGRQRDIREKEAIRRVVKTFDRPVIKEFLDCSDLSEKETRLKRSFRKARDASSKSKSRARAGRASRRGTDDDDERGNPAVPAEVEICLGKEAGCSSMDWQSSEPADAEAKERSSGDEGTETEPSKTTEEKRHKLDSGIGEENTPSGGSASHDSDGSDDSDDTEEDEGCDEDVKGRRRRRQKRGHLSTRSSSSTDEEGGADGAGRTPPRRAPRRDTDSARRAQLSILMKRGVKELPLPHALKKFVNLGRCFEF